MAISTDERQGLEGCAPAHGPRPAVPTPQGRRFAGRKLRAILAILLGVAALAACAPGQPTGQAPTAPASATVTEVPSPTATAVPRLVYQADWSHSLSGWNATPGWSVSGGVVQSDTGSDREITSPFLPATPNYAVEFNLQVVQASQYPPTQIEFSTGPTASVDGYIALFDNVRTGYYMFANHPHLMIYINPMIDQDPTTFKPHDFELGTRMRTYRVEVRGPEATLVINGQIANWARSTKSAQLSAGPFHISTTGVQVRLSDFKVYAL